MSRVINPILIKSNIFKKVRGLNLKRDQSLVDNDLSECSQIVIYWSSNPSGYLQSITIPKDTSEWFMPSNSVSNFVMYVAVKWIENKINVSPYASGETRNAIVGYDLIK